MSRSYTTFTLLDLQYACRHFFPTLIPAASPTRLLYMRALEVLPCPACAARGDAAAQARTILNETRRGLFGKPQREPAGVYAQPPLRHPAPHKGSRRITARPLI